MAMTNRFKQQREALGLTQTEVAKRAGVSQVSISELESGKATNPSWDLLASVAHALQAKPEDLMPPRIPGEVGERRGVVDRRKGGRRRANREHGHPDRRSVERR